MSDPTLSKEHAMRRVLASSLAVVAVSAGAALLGADLKSGLQVGDSTHAFNVKDITGPAKGTSLCYR
jgi:hypothetical protein